MQDSDESPRDDESSHSGRWGLMIALVLFLLAASAYSLVKLRNESTLADDLASTNQSLRDSLRQVQGQLQLVNDRLETLAQPKAPVRAVEQSVKTSSQYRAKNTVAAAKAANDPRWKQVQDRISDQQKQLEGAQQEIASTREDVDKTRQDLNGRLDSTRDELNGSVAKTHDELVALQQRGERNYFEFQLGKSKQFQRVGPVSLEVRKVDFKHKSYDLTLLVNDQKLDKKHVNLYEPITVRPSDQPVDLVVNEIGNNEIKGYVSEPKYKTPAPPPLAAGVN